MDHELRDLHRGAREERRRLTPDPDPYDDPGHGRPGGIDDPTPDSEYGDPLGAPERPVPAEEVPQDNGEELVTLPIPDDVIYDVADLGDGRIAVQWWGPRESTAESTEDDS